MRLNSNLPDRKRNRIRSWDYSENGYYFVTICAQNRFQFYFGDVVKSEMNYSEWGRIAKKYWEEIPQHFKEIELDIYQIMPNHIHGIIIVNNSKNSNEVVYNNKVVGVAYMRPLRVDRSKMLVSLAIQNYKAAISREIHKTDITFSWQRSFYDHVIRVEESLDKIREYILNNPAKWDLDKNNPNKKPGKYYFEY